jgi:hypothetical protein
LVFDLLSRQACGGWACLRRVGRGANQAVRKTNRIKADTTGFGAHGLKYSFENS